MIDHKCSPKVYVPVTPFERARSLDVALKGIWDSSSHPHVLWFWAVVELLVLFHTQPPVMLGCNADLKQWSPQEQEPHTIPHNTKHKVLPTFLCMYNACVTVCCVHADLCVCVCVCGRAWWHMFSSVIIHVICGYSASHLPWCSLVVDEMGSPGCSGDLPVSTPPFQGLQAYVCDHA